MSRPRVSVVLPFHSATPALAEMLERCALDGLRRHGPEDAELILVDDASPLRTAPDAAFMPSRLIRLERNAGFAGAVNAGLREARGETVLLLNSDARPTAGSVESLLRTLASDPRAGMAGPLSNGAFGAELQQVEGLAPLKDWSDAELARVDAYAEGLRAAAAPPAPAAYLMGFCLLARRELLEDVGPLDERFGLGYSEELDWCLRARKKGWKILVDRSAFVFHAGSRTMGGRPWSARWHIIRNSAYLFWKHGFAVTRKQPV